MSIHQLGAHPEIQRPVTTYATFNPAPRPPRHRAPTPALDPSVIVVQLTLAVLVALSVFAALVVMLS